MIKINPVENIKNKYGAKGLLDFFGKETFAFHFIKTNILNADTTGFDDLYIYPKTFGLQAVLHMMGLPKCESAATGTDNNGALAHGRKILV